MTKRAYLTTAERIAILAQQQGRCSMCDKVLYLDEPIEYDHWVPVALGNSAKPDSAMHKHCHARKTKQDVRAIAKAKRIERKRLGLAKPKRPIPSRPFDKRYRKKMSGKVEART